MWVRLRDCEPHRQSLETPRPGTLTLPTVLILALPESGNACSMLQGGTVLLLGDSRAFFAVYGIISSAGMRAFQLDRAGRMVEGSPSAGAVGSTVAAAAGAADCILATYQQLLLPGFPLDLFSCVVEYAPQAAADAAAIQAATAMFASAQWLKRVTFSMDETPGGRTRGGDSPPVAAMRPADSNHWYNQADGLVVPSDATAEEGEPDDTAEGRI